MAVSMIFIILVAMLMGCIVHLVRKREFVWCLFTYHQFFCVNQQATCCGCSAAQAGPSNKIFTRATPVDCRRFPPPDLVVKPWPVPTWTCRLSRRCRRRKCTTCHCRSQTCLASESLPRAWTRLRTLWSVLYSDLSAWEILLLIVFLYRTYVVFK